MDSVRKLDQLTAAGLLISIGIENTQARYSGCSDRADHYPAAFPGSTGGHLINRQDLWADHVCMVHHDRDYQDCGCFTQSIHHNGLKSGASL
jgi:hypothetical protein